MILVYSGEKEPSIKLGIELRLRKAYQQYKFSDESGVADGSCRADSCESYGDMKLVLHHITNPNIV